MKCEFIDAQVMAMRNPGTFDVPEPHVLAGLVPSDNVKVCAAGERFWVFLSSVRDGKLYGQVNNATFGDHGLEQGDQVVLETRHVYSVQKAD